LISSTDEAVTATGVSGVRGGSQASTTGRHGDNFVATDAASAAVPPSMALLGVGV